MSESIPTDTTVPERPLSDFDSATESIVLSLAQIATWQLDSETFQVRINEDCARLLNLEASKEISFQRFVHVLSPTEKEDLKQTILAVVAGRQVVLNVQTSRFVFKAAAQPSGISGKMILAGVVLENKISKTGNFITDYESKGLEVGAFQIDLLKETMSYTPALAKNLTGRADRDLTREDFIRHIHPEDAHIRFLAYETALQTGDLHYEGRTIWNDDSVHWVRIIGSYSFNEAGVPVHLFGIVQDITDTKIRDRALRETETHFRNMIQQAPMAIALLMGRDMVVEVGNNKIFELWGKQTGMLGLPLMEVLPELKGQEFPKLLENVYNTGVPYFGESMRVELFRNGEMETSYFDFTYAPLCDQEGTITGIMVLANEVTAQVMARKKLEESERRFVTLIEEAPFATSLYKGKDMVIEIANDAMIRLWGKDSSVIGQKLALAIPELEGQPFLDLLDKVFTTGVAHHEKEARADLVVDGQLTTFYFNYTYKPIRDEHGQVYGILNMALDVTNQVLSHRKLEESELFAHSIIYNSPVAKLVLTGQEQVISIANENLLQLFGHTNAILNHSFQEVFPDLWLGMHEQLMHVLHTGETFTANEAPYPITRSGVTETHYFNVIFKALPSAGGGFYGVIITMVDVTEQVQSRTSIAEAKEALKGAIELAELGTWELDLKELLFYYSNRLAAWYGVAENTPVPMKQVLMTIHEEDRDRVSETFEKAYSSEQQHTFNSEYRLVHPHTGVTRILHAQGMTYLDLEGKPFKMTGTVRDVTKERQTQAALELEVKKRTAELNLLNKQLTDAVSELAAANEQLKRSNEDLAQYAHVASHDLQEPLRKIRMFSGMLKDQSVALPGNSSLVKKINESAERMSLLIKDLLDYSRLLKTEDLKKKVDLNEVISQVMVDFELRIQEKNATVTVEHLPEIEAVPLQMSQLFFNLIGNALKFSVAEREPVIRISSNVMNEGEINRFLPLLQTEGTYFHITISDNGIGFEDKYAQQIFEVFKRLHGRDVYPGSGIGLALCRRIVDNHQGHIFATSAPDNGTTFHLLLPARQDKSK